jgi:predicted RNase H-like nuclease (RuvC/YqgF family)
LEEKIRSLECQNKRIEVLEQKNKDLEDETSNYQSKLGIATNTMSGDDQFNDDIIKLQDNIDDYVTNLKATKVEIKLEEIKNFYHFMNVKSKSIQINQISYLLKLYCNGMY